jgi:hypothetical protein
MWRDEASSVVGLRRPDHSPTFAMDQAADAWRPARSLQRECSCVEPGSTFSSGVSPGALASHDGVCASRGVGVVRLGVMPPRFALAALGGLGPHRAAAVARGHDRDQDLNQHPGPSWLDDLAMRGRARLAELALPLVVGHGAGSHRTSAGVAGGPGWCTTGTAPWRNRAAIAGQAAAVWPAAGGPGEAASIDQTEQFLSTYEQVRGRPWTPAEREACWAAGLWVRAFNAKKDAVVGGGPQLDRLSYEAAQRARDAGI